MYHVWSDFVNLISRAHNNFLFLKKDFSKTEKVLTVFSITENMFSKIKLTGPVYIYIHNKD